MENLTKKGGSIVITRCSVIHVSKESIRETPKLQNVLKQRCKVLNEPMRFPLERHVDLKSNINPPNIRHYRYSYQQNIGIERLIQDIRIDQIP
jgi:hypothetical protein